MRSPVALLAVAVAAVVVLILAESPIALTIVMTDGLLAGAIVALSMIPGLSLLRLFGIREESVASRIIFGGGLGVGVLCLLELTLGVCGLLTRGWWIAAFGVVIMVSLIPFLRGLRDLVASQVSFKLPSIQPAQWLWLAVVPFAALTLLVATAPPGVLWPAEGNGYDVLEYHLAVPRQYYEAGHIFFLPNNAYSNFPFNAEMLYLLAMVLRGGPIEGIMLAQTLNAATAILFVAAMWAAARPLGSRPSLVAAVLAGTCGWLVYLSGVAYVENAMLLFGALAFGAWVRWAHETPPLNRGGPGEVLAPPPNKGRRAEVLAPPLNKGGQGGVEGAKASASCVPWPLLAGLFAGLACGCKYTAVVLVVVPLAIAFVLTSATRLSRRTKGDPMSRSVEDGLAGLPIQKGSSLPRALLLLALGVVATFTPWLLKNAVFCGNPVFPQATAQLGYRPGIWGKDCETRWTHGHLPPTELRSLSGRLRATWHAVIAEPRTGPAIWLLAAFALILNTRRSWPLAVIVVLQIVLWASLTHLADRFAVPILPPLILLAACIVEPVVTIRAGEGAFTQRLKDEPASDVRGAAAQKAPSLAAVTIGPGLGLREPKILPIVAVLLLGAAVNLYHVSGLYYDRTRLRTPEGRVERIPWYGQVQWFTEGQWPGAAHLGSINHELPANANVLLVADARSFYVLRKCDYCVVFNPNPFAEAVRETGDGIAILAWLRRAGYTHVYVDWMEMNRLRATYGFWNEIDEGLFVRLEKLGLRRIKDFTFGEGQRPYGTIYEVRP